MPRTGDINETLGGLYAGDCCDAIVVLPIGFRFPTCPKCRRETSFRLTL